MVSRRRRFRRRGRRRRFRRRRMRRSRAFNVRYHTDFELGLSSLVPSATSVNGTYVGVSDGNYATWSVPIVPPSFIYAPGASVLGSWGSQALTTRSIGNQSQEFTDTLMITDLPTCISSNNIFGLCNCSDLAELMTKYRIAYCTATFTIPENTDGQKNHHLYIEWTHLPLATACKSESLYDLLMTPSSGLNDDTYGFNWICNPMDIAEACCVPGKANGKHKWQRAQLTATAPVTIRWRPRHAAIRNDRNYYLDSTGNGVDFKHMDQFAMKSALVRSYLPINRSESVRPHDDQVWMGPIVRVIDADIPVTALGSLTPQDFISKYHIRVSFNICLKLKGMKANDALFPTFKPTIPT